MLEEPIVLEDIGGYHCDNCFIPSGSNYFVNCFSYLAQKGYNIKIFAFRALDDGQKSVFTLPKINHCIAKSTSFTDFLTLRNAEEEFFSKLHQKLFLFNGGD